jgi:hypothetical protein
MQSVAKPHRHQTLLPSQEGRPRKPRHITIVLQRMPRPRRLLHMGCRAVVSAEVKPRVVAVLVTFAICGREELLEPPRSSVEE